MITSIEIIETNFIDGLGFHRMSKDIKKLSMVERKMLMRLGRNNPVELLKKYIENLQYLPLTGHYKQNKQMYIAYAEGKIAEYEKEEEKCQ